MKKIILSLSVMSFLLVAVLSSTGIQAQGSRLIIETFENDVRYSYSIEQPTLGTIEGTLRGNQTLEYENGSNITLIANEYYDYGFEHWFDNYDNAIISNNKTLVLEDYSSDMMIEPIYSSVHKETLYVNTTPFYAEFEYTIIQPTLGTLTGTNVGGFAEQIERGSHVTLTKVMSDEYNFDKWFNLDFGIEYFSNSVDFYVNSTTEYDYINTFDYGMDVRVIDVSPTSVEIEVVNTNDVELRLDFGIQLTQDPLCTSTPSSINVPANTTSVFTCTSLNEDTVYDFEYSIRLDNVFQGVEENQFTTPSSGVATQILNKSTSEQGLVFYYEDSLGRNFYSVNTYEVITYVGSNVTSITPQQHNFKTFQHYYDLDNLSTVNNISFSYTVMDIMDDFNFRADYIFNRSYISVSSNKTLQPITMNTLSTGNINDNPIYEVLDGDTNINLSAPSLTANGLYFVEWYDEIEGLTLSTQRTNFNFTLDRDYDVTAVYRDANEYNVLLDSNIGSASLTFNEGSRTLTNTTINTTHTEGLHIDIIAPEVSGYTFLHWYDSINDEFYTTREFNNVLFNNNISWTAIYEPIPVIEYFVTATTSVLTSLVDLTLDSTEFIQPQIGNPVNSYLDESKDFSLFAPESFVGEIGGIEYTFNFQFWYDNDAGRPLEDGEGASENYVFINDLQRDYNLTAIYEEVVEYGLESSPYLYTDELLRYAFEESTNLSIQTSANGRQFSTIYTTNTNYLMFNFSDYMNENNSIIYRVRNNSTNETIITGIVTYRPSTQFSNRDNAIGVGGVVYNDSYSGAINDNNILHDRNSPNQVVINRSNTHLLVHYTLESISGYFQIGYQNQQQTVYNIPIEDIIEFNNGELDGYFAIPLSQSPAQWLQDITPYVTVYQPLAQGVYIYRVHDGVTIAYPDSIFFISATDIEYSLTLRKDNIRVGSSIDWILTRNTQEVYNVYNIHQFTDFRQSTVTNQIIPLNLRTNNFSYVVEIGFNQSGTVNWDISPQLSNFMYQIPTGNYTFTLSESYQRHHAIGIEGNVNHVLSLIGADTALGRTLVVVVMITLISFIMLFFKISFYPLLLINLLIVIFAIFVGMLELWIGLMIVVVLFYLVYFQISRKGSD